MSPPLWGIKRAHHDVVGIIAEFEDVRCFLPISQLAYQRDLYEISRAVASQLRPAGETCIGYGPLATVFKAVLVLSVNFRASRIGSPFCP